MDEFRKNAPQVEVVEDASRRAPDEVVAAARSRLGEGGYNLAENNCQHFATKCRTGEHRSEQVEAVEEAIATIDDAFDEIYEWYQDVKTCFTSPSTSARGT